ncbi:hypothetical protein Q9295_03615 [Xinfangfangia sp. CPCC 101601]|uniref:Uncharacterized protein n=1 Tax=Pseudogemmobacter lacusdianii TaxID=3069608 RepID=A0ABU0VUP5_9RHOB|nr:hypothetical protein [Xinfangfangia sp. CPCC 101601]MDQ2065449.1 hypothetical protein [Xinfangfangia sp. CPCC 101601]
MNPRWLMKAKRWAQNPPSARQVVFYGAILALCLAVAGFEWFFGWPEALTPARLRP